MRAMGIASNLVLPLAGDQRLAERLKQRAVDRIALRVILRMPLHAEGKARRVGNPDRFDSAVLRDAFDDDALAGVENALAMQRVDTDGFAAEQFCESAAGKQGHLVAIGENDRVIGMDLAVLQPW